MKNISTGVGLAILGLGIALHPLLSGLASSATASASTAPAAAALASTANAQAGPTVVWYGNGNSIQYAGDCGDNDRYEQSTVYRAWSDGRVEFRTIRRKIVDFAHPSDPCNGRADLHCVGDAPMCTSPWITVSTAAQGYRAAADINADELVDGVDLASVLGNWGNAPRVPFPPSDCPLNLINP